MQYTLRELRARKHITQKQAAQALGVSNATYNAWERDISKTSVSRAQAVAQLYEVTLNDIFIPKT